MLSARTVVLAKGGGVADRAYWSPPLPCAHLQNVCVGGGGRGGEGLCAKDGVSLPQAFPIETGGRCFYGALQPPTRVPLPVKARSCLTTCKCV